MVLSGIDIPACASTVRRRVSSNVLWSLGGNVASTLTGLLLVRIMCQNVEPSDYGAASLILGILALVNSALVGPIMAAHLRLFFDYAQSGLEAHFASAFKNVLIIAICCSVVIYIGVASGYRLAGQSVYTTLFVPATCLIVTQAFLTLVTNHLEVRRSYKPLAFVNIAAKGSQVAALFLLLAVDVSGVKAVLYSQVAANIATTLFYRRQLKSASTERPIEKCNRNRAISINLLLKSLAKFGWALPCGYVVSWVLCTGDRYMLEHFVSIREVGRYTMNYGFWSMPFLVLNAWLELLTRPRIYSESAARQWAAVEGIIRYRLGIGAALGSVGLLSYLVIGKRLAIAMLGERYWAGEWVMVIIGLAHLLYVAGYSIVPVFLALKRPAGILWATSVAAGINITYDIFAIPHQGILGAAIGTFLGYAAFVATLLGLAKRIMKTPELEVVFAR